MHLLRSRVEESPNINYEINSRLQSVTAIDSETLSLNIKTSSETGELKCHYLIFAVGRLPRLGFISNRLELVKQDLTDRSRLYFAGDVKNDIFRQSSIAVGDGIKTAMQIYSKLKGKTK